MITSGLAPVISALLTGVLALSGMYVLVRGMWPLRRRRVFTGLGLLAASGLLIWAWVGSPVGVPRAVVVVFSDDASTEDLKAISSHFGSGDQLCWIRVSRDQLNAPHETSWISGADAPPAVDEPNEAYRRRVDEQAVPVSLNGPDWLANLLVAERAARVAFSRPGAEAYQHSLVVLHDRGPTWGSLRSQGLDLAEAITRLNAPLTQVYLLPAQSDDLPGSLEIELSREVVPPVRVVSLGSQQIRLYLRGAERLRSALTHYKLDLWLDGGPDTPDDPHHRLTASFSDPGPERSLLHTIVLADAQPQGGATNEAALRSGLHRVLVRLTVDDKRPGTSPLTYDATRYFLVDPRGILLLHPKGGLGELAQPTWKRPPADPAKLLDKFLRNFNLVGQRGRSELSVENVMAFDFEANASVIRAAAKNCRATILVEPTHAQLVRMDSELSLEQRVRDGETLLIVGPPVRAKPWPTWLPWSARPAPGTEDRWEIHRDRRVYFFPENLRLLKFPSRDLLARDLASDDVTGLRAQRDVIQAVCSGLGVTETVVRVEHENEVAPCLAFEGNFQPRQGRFERDGVEVATAVYPPLAPYLHQGTNEGPAFHPDWETIAGFVPARLAPLEDETALKGIHLPPLRGPHLHPGASVILFLDDLPQPTAIPEGAANAYRVAGAPDLIWPSAPSRRDCVARLARLGVTVYAVRLKLDADYNKALTGQMPQSRVADSYLDPIRRDPELAPFLREIILELTPASVKQVGDQLTQWVKEQPGTLVRNRAGRIIDERGLVSRPAPDRHLLLKSDDSVSELDSPHASIEDVRFAKEHPGRRAPAVQAHTLREGSVVILGYSPFARDLWERDAGAAGWDANSKQSFPPADGWGVQRLLDLTELTTPERVSSEGHPVVRGARVLQDSTMLWLDCWVNLSKQTGWAEPTLHRLNDDIPAAQAVAQGRIHAIDPHTQSVTFQVQYSGKVPLHGWFAIDLGGRKENPDAKPAIYLDLQPLAPGSRAVRETFGRLTGLTGGAVLTHETAASSLVCKRSAAWLSSFLLTALTILMLSPLFRPWAILRRRRRGKPADASKQPAASFDVQGVLVEWGLNPGSPRSARRAGDPAGQKPYEAGDSLSTARPATLLAIVTGGKLLPLRRPIVRQRFVGRAMEAMILLDCTPGLFIPDDTPSKADYLVLLVRLIAGAVWGTGGVVRIESLQQPDQAWGPRGAGDDSEHLAQFVSECLRNGARLSVAPLRLPEDVGSGRVLFLISDMLSDHEKNLPKILGECAREDVSLRLLHVRGAHDGELVGIGVSAMTNRLLDRAEWLAEDVTAEQEAHATRLRAIVEAAGGRFATITTDLRIDDVFDQMIQHDLLT
ncbi:DUF58 domain-containing protein [Zavarzinella formosa]|uniref:hypothetical protein n=1 Tax=Zavarzinella formosa TaxID=360055 RepID=UPI0002D83386|nr:hypothetical protein [Zavarzinella formosa]